MTAFDTQTDQLRAGAEASHHAAESIGEGLNRLMKEAESVVGASWRGPAANDFRAGLEEWHEGGLETIAGLTQQAQALSVAAATYQQTDTSSAARERAAGARVFTSGLNA